MMHNISMLRHGSQMNGGGGGGGSGSGGGGGERAP